MGHSEVGLLPCSLAQGCPFGEPVALNLKGPELYDQEEGQILRWVTGSDGK